MQLFYGLVNANLISSNSAGLNKKLKRQQQAPRPSLNVGEAAGNNPCDGC